VALKARQRPPQELGHAVAARIAQHLDEGSIDGHVDVLPADAAYATAAIAGYAMADPSDSAEFLDVELQQFPSDRRPSASLEHAAGSSSRSSASALTTFPWCERESGNALIAECEQDASHM
jgi:hypothetical protein